MAPDFDFDAWPEALCWLLIAAVGLFVVVIGMLP